MMSMTDSTTQQSGFALLVSIIVVGVVLSVGLVILDLTIKQVRLAVTTTDSEIAFHAANAGMECARFIRRNYDSAVVSGQVLASVACFDVNANPFSVTPSPVPFTGGDASVESNHYTYQFTWGAADSQRCTVVDMVAVSVPTSAAGPITISNAAMRSSIEGYPGSDPFDCQLGGDCTMVAVRGYNQVCPASGVFDFGVVERKVLLEF